MRIEVRTISYKREEVEIMEEIGTVEITMAQIKSMISEDQNYKVSNAGR